MPSNGNHEAHDYAERLRERLTEALVAYGLGRPLSFSDEQLLQPLLAETKADSYCLADLIHAIVQSREFRMK